MSWAPEKTITALKPGSIEYVCHRCIKMSVIV